MPPWWIDVCSSYRSVLGYTVWIEDQEDVSVLRGVECIDASLALRAGSVEDPLVDLGGASSLRAIAWHLDIEETALERLTGLEQLEWVSGELNIGNIAPDAVGCFPNRNLIDLDALANLQHFTTLFVCGELQDSLASIDGLDSALQGEIDGDVSLVFLQVLPSIAAFDGVTRIHGGLELVALPQLLDLAPLGDLTQAANLSIDGTAVQDLHGLESLEQIDHRLIINGNASLTTLAGLDALTDVDDVFITNNPQLPQSEVDAFIASLDPPGAVGVCGNLGGAPC